MGNEECTKLLLEYGADPNRWDSPTERKATPLHCAASAKCLKCVKVKDRSNLHPFFVRRILGCYVLTVLIYGLYLSYIFYLKSGDIIESTA